jgi:hypothetical protein
VWDFRQHRALWQAYLKGKVSLSSNGFDTVTLDSVGILTGRTGSGQWPTVRSAVGESRSSLRRLIQRQPTPRNWRICAEGLRSSKRASGAEPDKWNCC